MVVTVRAELVRFFEGLRVFAEGFAALLAGECHIKALKEGVFLLFSVAFCTVEPFSAAGGADGDLGVEDVFAHGG